MTALISRRNVVSALVPATLVLCAGALVAGPLSPPGGPVASSYKTLTEVEPRIALSQVNTPGNATTLFRLTQPGSYYLTGNAGALAAQGGIEIAANNVTIDLNGFELTGVAAGLSNGIDTDAAGRTNITIKNGTVRGFGSYGVLLTTAKHVRLVNVNAVANGEVGLRAGAASMIDGCIASGTGATGNGNGIIAGEASTVTRCAAYQNEGLGISAGAGSTVESCASKGNGTSGFSVSDGGTIRGCASMANANNGITAYNGVLITDCTVTDNVGHGILVYSSCTVRGNTCKGNGVGASTGSGVQVNGSDTHVELNTCTGADKGIGVDTTGNFINRNTCSGNTTNYVVIAGNACYVVNATVSGAISGNSGGFSFGSSDPNANFAY